MGGPKTLPTTHSLTRTKALSSLAYLGKHGLENPRVAVSGWSPGAGSMICTCAQHPYKQRLRVRSHGTCQDFCGYISVGFWETKSGLRETGSLASLKTGQHSSLPRQVLVTGKTRPRQDPSQVSPFSDIQETCS